MEYAVPADHRLKVKESDKRDKFLDFAREQKKSWNMRMMVMLIVIGAFGMVLKGLERAWKS